MSKVIIGTITYRASSAKYLPDFLASLKAQTFTDFSLYVYDNTDDSSRLNDEALERAEVIYKKFGTGKNIGFGAAYNEMLRAAAEAGAEYFLALNPDMIFDQAMLMELVAYADTNPEITAVVPKIFRWDFANKVKTKIIDSYGLIGDKKFRFFDNFQGLIDKQQIKEPQEVFGFTGAAVLFRLKQLEAVKIETEYFDEMMFMYKEDCDLSIRLKMAKLKTIIVPSAIAYHDRTAAIVGRSIFQLFANRNSKSEIVKRWSFKNQLIVVFKFWPYMTPSLKFGVFFQVLKMLIFVVVFERFLLAEFFTVLKLRAEIKRRANLINNRLTPSEFSALFSAD
jgi:GT2 family glycosyltransferase